MAEQKMLHPYPEYKDSGVEWINEIPAHWEALQLKRVCVIQTGYAFKNDDYVDSGIPLLRIGNILEDGTVTIDGGKYLPISFLKEFGQYAINQGDILMAMTGATIGKVGKYTFKKPSLLNQRVCKFQVVNIEHQYLWWHLNSLAFIEYVRLTATGGAQENISDVLILESFTCFPPLPEQQKIADFLDYETEQMDRLIAKQERLIELLAEKRQAVISHAVTKGLNPDAPMKDSGVEWIGEIPAHWEVKKLSYCSRLITEKRVAKSAKEIVALENIEGFTGKFLNTTNDLVGEGVDFQKGDVLFGKLRPYLAKVYLAEMKGVAFGDLLVYRPNPEVLSKYLWAQMLSLEFIKEVDSSTYGTKMPRAATEFISNMPIVTPPFTEQEEIVQFLETELAKMDALTAKAEQQIELLKERRRALISAAVTGKIDLRHWQPRRASQSSTSQSSTPEIHKE